MMRSVGVAIWVLGLAAALAACSKHDEDEDAAGFRPPTNQTRADYLDMLGRSFAKLDRNGDGLIKADEISGKRGDRIRKRDTDHDGFVSREEFIKGGLARFDRLDVNHDGVLTNAERDADHGEGTDVTGNVTP